MHTSTNPLSPPLYLLIPSLTYSTTFHPTQLPIPLPPPSFYLSAPFYLSFPHPPPLHIPLPLTPIYLFPYSHPSTFPLCGSSARLPIPLPPQPLYLSPMPSVSPSTYSTTSPTPLPIHYPLCRLSVPLPIPPPPQPLYLPPMPSVSPSTYSANSPTPLPIPYAVRQSLYPFRHLPNPSTYPLCRPSVPLPIPPPPQPLYLSTMRPISLSLCLFCYLPNSSTYIPISTPLHMSPPPTCSLSSPSTDSFPTPLPSGQWKKCNNIFFSLQRQYQDKHNFQVCAHHWQSVT